MVHPQTAWQYHVSSTDATHHPKECWLVAGAVNVLKADASDVRQPPSRPQI